MKTTITFIAALLLNFTAFSQTWKSDKAHSHITFTITHLTVSDVDGIFKDFDAKITASKPDFSDAKFELTVNTSSVNTDNDDRDKDLKSANFFNVDKYPTITFVSTTIKSTGKNQYKLSGNLTMLGITKPVEFDLTYRGTITNPMTKAPDAGFVVSGTLKRSIFGLGSKYGPPMLSDEVTIKASGEFAKVN